MCSTNGIWILVKGYLKSKLTGFLLKMKQKSNSVSFIVYPKILLFIYGLTFAWEKNLSCDNLVRIVKKLEGLC